MEMLILILGIVAISIRVLISYYRILVYLTNFLQHYLLSILLDKGQDCNTSFNNSSELKQAKQVFGFIETAVFCFTILSITFTIAQKLKDMIMNYIENFKLIFFSFVFQLRMPATCSTCSICLLDQAYILLKCGHVFHLQCIKKWKKQKNSCPYCRAPILLS